MAEPARAPVYLPTVTVHRLRVVLAIVLIIVFVIGIYLVARFTSNTPVAYESIEDKFKYGSTGGEIDAGIPVSLWKTLPKLFPELLPPRKFSPGQEYGAFGFLYED